MNGTDEDFGLDLVVADSKIVIQKVREASDAAAAGMQAGDQIKLINGLQIKPDMYYLDSLIDSILESNQDSIEIAWYSHEFAREQNSKIGLSPLKTML